METIAYVYKWINIITGRWYIGCRIKVGCHPADGYICSSKIVKPMIRCSPNEWRREILFTGSPNDVLQYESDILKELDAKNDPTSFNLHNGDGKFTTNGITMPAEWRAKISKALTGLKRSEESKAHYRFANQKKAKDPEYLQKLRKPKPEGHGAKVSEATKGVAKSAEHRANLSKSQKISAAKYRTGKTYEELYGAERAIQMRKLASESKKGKPCTNPIVTCPHCGRSGPSGAMNRWHFNNCKAKTL